MISAVALAEKGIKLAVNTTKLFAADMSVQKKPFSCELSLSPLFLNDINACWLVNLVALEAIEATTASRINKDGYVVSSYGRTCRCWRCSWTRRRMCTSFGAEAC